MMAHPGTANEASPMQTISIRTCQSASCLQMMLFGQFRHRLPPYLHFFLFLVQMGVVQDCRRQGRVGKKAAEAVG
jgi:hypothetical protein